MKIPDDAYFGAPANRPVLRHALAIRLAALVNCRTSQSEKWPAVSKP
jgi:hypothetical protein